MMKLVERFGCLVLFGLILSAFSAFTQAQNPVSWSIKSGKSWVKAGEKFTVQVSASIEGGWYVYSITQGAGGPIATRITVAGAPFSLSGSIKGPAPQKQMDPNFEIVTEKYKGGATFTIPIAVAGDAQPGPQTLNVNVRFQTCNDKTCLPPKTVKLSVPVEISAAAAVPAVAAYPSPSPTQTATPKNSNSNAIANTNSDLCTNTNTAGATQVEILEPNSNSDSAIASTQSVNIPPYTNVGSAGFDLNSTLLAFLWTAMFAGALSLLTPCVFPMIPITVSYFTNHSGGSRGKATVSAFVFTLGIVFTFTVLGILLAVFFGAAGINKFAANPYVNILIAGLFIAFALSLFGAFNIGLPTSVLTRLDSFSRGRESSQFLGLLLMGLVFSVTSFTCTAPLLGGLFVLATQGNWFYPILGMLAFSSVFALPFFVLALAPQLVAQLPRSGGWLNSVKVVMGFLEVAAAMKFISNVDLVWGWGIFTREVVLAAWVAVALLIAVYLLGIFHFTHDIKTERIGAVRAMVSFVFLSLSFYMLTGLFGQNLGELESFLPPRITNTTATGLVTSGNSNSASKIGELDWITNDFESALAKARSESKPLFIDFTGYTCTNCRWMEANMFPRPNVHNELEKFVRVRLYTDGDGEPYESFQRMQEERFKTVALPLYAILDESGNTIKTFPGLTRNTTEFAAFLKLN